MRRLFFLLISVLLFGFVWWLRGAEPLYRFVVPENGDVLYATTFTDGRFAEDWSLEERRGYLSEVRDGALHLTIQEAVFLAPGTPNAIRAMNRYTFRDFDYRVRTTVLEGPENNSFGLIFRQQDPQTYYIFYISSDGYYSVWRETPTGRFALSTWIPTDVINLGTDGVVNEIQVIGTGNTFRFSVNGETLLLCVPNSPNGESTYIESTGECVEGVMQATLTDDVIQMGQLGVIVNPFASGQITVAFDNPLVLPAE